MKDFIGKKVSHYEILNYLGGGGMGMVYKARDTRLNRHVALKFLPPELTRDNDAKQRFIHEAQTASALDHNNICTIHEIDETKDQQLFICMAYYNGENLKKKIQHEPLKIKDILTIAYQMANGLQCAHQAGIIHRDIKPANVMITEKEEVKIVDFGLAKLAGQQTITKAGMTLGTVAYMSPEQIQGEQLDERSDIWSFGVVLYEMLTGEMPFKGEYDLPVMYSIMNETPSEISQLRNDVPTFLALLCMNCLSKNKEDRPKSFKKIIQILREESSLTDKLFLKTAIYSNYRYAIITIFTLIIIFTLFFIFYNPFKEKNGSSGNNLRIAVLPFKIAAEEFDSSNLSQVVQALIVRNLTGVEGLAVVDQPSLNAMIFNTLGSYSPSRNHTLYQLLKDIDVSHIIDGSILSSDHNFSIQYNIINTTTHEIKFANNINLIDEKYLLHATEELSKQVLSYYQVQNLLSENNQDLRPWFRFGSQNIEAIKAFLQASQYNYLWEPTATKYILQAIELDSNFISPRIWLISKLVQSGEHKEAIFHYKHLLTLQTKASPFEQVMIDWAGAHINNNIQSQIKYLKLALDYSPNNNILTYTLARLLYIIGNYQESIEALEHIKEMKLQYSPAYYLLGANYFELGEYEKSRDILKSSLDIKPVYPELYFLGINIYLKLDEISDAKKYETLYFEKIHQSGLAQDIIYNRIAQVKELLKEYEIAKKNYRLAINSNPNASIYRTNLAELYRKTGRQDSAYKECLKTLEIDSKNAKAQLILGYVCKEKGDFNSAIKYFKKYLELDSLGPERKDVNDILLEIEDYYQP